MAAGTLTKRTVDAQRPGEKDTYLWDARHNATALEVLANILRLEENPYVICGEKPGTHLVNLQKSWRRIRLRGLSGLKLRWCVTSAFDRYR